MARIKPSALITDIRGKVQGTVFQQSQGGLIIRNNPAPINPSTIPQNVARNISFNLQQRWIALTDAQRIAWQNFATFTPQGQKNNPNRFLNGQQVFIKLNTNRIRYSKVVIDDPVFQAPSQLPLQIEIVKSGAGVTLQTNVSPVVADQFIILFLTFAVPFSVNSPGNRLKLIPFVTTSATTLDIDDEFIAVFGQTMPDDVKYFWRAATADLDTGLISNFELKTGVFT